MLPLKPTSTLTEKLVGDTDKNVKPDRAPENVPHIALIVPLASKTFDRVADAVRLGFLAGAEADRKEAPAYRIYPAADDTVALSALYRKAVNDGAIAIVGGVTRDGANVLAKEAGNIPSLALNAPSETDTPNNFYYVSLNLDWEARLVARAAAQEGFRRVAIVGGNTGLAKRISDSFEKEWIRLGGEVAGRVPFGGELAELTRVKSPLERAKADVIFLSVDARGARAVRPYLPTAAPVFATSQSLDPYAGRISSLDLDGLRYLEMPWFVENDHPAVMAYRKPAVPLPLDYERLYALGIDAWRLTQVMLKADKPRDVKPLDGVIGRLTLDGAQWVRALATVEMRDGRPNVARTSE